MDQFCNPSFYIYKGNYQKQQIIIPPKKEQKKIYIHLDKIISNLNALMNAEQKKIRLLYEYRQSIISLIVTGKIRITQDMI